eukprot:CAMPEP_0174817746 /NCGR_PEP_ID=MMETSP1107-20130205/254_1 /TAXON_ID=36770 /ORGANISM="Paraphysomonas vestita, Strain GFlagA" /LENGTH=652 /DNA_ID=CAMNT_0016028733 /DNA_START=1071 /DNA_END=3029 /DNA_ORIENTATION=+
MLLDEDRLKETANAGNPEKNIASIDILHDPEETELRPYEMIYAKYRDELTEELYWRPKNLNHPFRESVRLKLTQILIESPPPDKTNPIKLRQGILKGRITAFFPLHNIPRLNEIKEKWLSPSVLPWQQPFFEIKEYFGEKIGLYFKFMAHYNLWLTGPALIGIPLQIYIVAINNFSSPVQIAFAVFIVIWAVIMLEFWKRKEKMTAIEWGMIGFEDEEVNRPEFKGETKKSLINGQFVMYFPPKQRMVLIAQSSAVIATLILVVIGAVTSIYIIKRALAEPLGSNAQTVASILNSVQISVFNLIYSFVADKLTERENHRTDTEYEDSMISKLFLFQFVNSYASFFYIAFVAPYTPASDDNNDDWEGDCGAPNCMVPLAINLAIIFGTRLTVGNITELALPYILFLRKYAQETAFAQGELLRPEREFMLTNYNIMKSSLNDYAEIAINFGFIALFVTALPIAAFAGFISSLLEVKADAWKLMLIYQRPIPRGAEDIGMWQQIFTIVASVACITNAALSVFTMDVLDKYSPWFRMWFFILFQWICFSIQTIAMALVPDEPQESIIQRARRDFLTEKVILQIPDEVLGGDALLGEDDGEGGEGGEGKEGTKEKPDIKFPIHEYTSTKDGTNYTLTPDIPVPPPAPKKKKLFKKND